MSENPLVSAIIPTYNRPDVKEAVESALNQTYENIEVIVVDDHSDTPASERLESLKSENLKIRRHDTNRMVSAARNTGIENAEGEYVAFLDDDDRWREEKIERQMKAVGGNDAELCFTGFYRGMSEEADVVLPNAEGDPKYNILKMDIRAAVGSTMLVNRQIAVEAGLFDENLDFSEDFEFLLRVLELTKLATVNEPLIFREISDESRSAEDFAEGKMRFLSKADKHIQKLGFFRSRRIYSAHYLNISNRGAFEAKPEISITYLVKAFLKYPLLPPKPVGRTFYYLAKNSIP